MLDAVITSACRTPIGALGGGLAELEGHQLGAKVLTESLSRSAVKPEEVDEVIMGQVLVGGAGQNPARQAAIAAGLPHGTVALSINQVCGSGLRAVGLAARAVSTADARIIIAGGQESMSRARHCAYLRAGLKIGHAELVDSMIQDGLWDAFHACHMGITAENVARQWGITRECQDAFALASQKKAAAALAAGRFDEEIVPVAVKTRKGNVIRALDEHPRPETKAEDLARLRPAFDREAGTVTAGNASGINDGAAALVIMSAEEAARRQIEPLARIVSVVSRGVPPEIMGSGPIPASRAALEQANWSIDSLDLIEANEAFAAQACAVNHELGWDPEKVNVNGGAIALGHPIGASGARILVTLLFEMKRRGSKRGLATLCIGGGMGIAMCVER